MSLLSSLFGDDENAQRAAEADVQLRELNRRRAATLGPEWSAKVEADYNAQQDGGWVTPAEQEKQIDQAFAEGWEDGKKNISSAVSGFFRVIGDGLSSILLGVPAWVWISALLGVWVYLGAPGLKLLKKKFA